MRSTAITILIPTETKPMDFLLWLEGFIAGIADDLPNEDQWADIQSRLAAELATDEDESESDESDESDDE